MSEPAPRAEDRITQPTSSTWQRLDRRMLLVHPITEVIRFLPVLVGIFLLGRDGGGWQLLGVAAPVLYGLWRFFTTSFRITETQVELKRGLLSRKVLTARLDRVRSVEVTSPLIHRLLGLAKVRIGTGSAATLGEDGFDLDALREPAATQLRQDLLRMTAREPSATTPEEPDVGEEVLLRLDPRWARFAPFTSSGAVIAAGVAAVVSQVFGAVEVDVGPSSEVSWLGGVLELPVVPLVLVVVVLLVLLAAVFGVLGYLVTNWGFTLSRDAAGRSLRVRRGLLTTTDTSLETQRVRGVELVEPLGLRSIGASRLQALVVGASLMQGGTTTIAPNCPRPTAVEVTEQVIGADGLLDLPLTRHGPVARRRRFVRTLVPVATVLIGLAVAASYDVLPWWAAPAALALLPLGALLAADRYRRLGHVLTPTHLVSRSGSLAGRHTVLDLDGVIGWHVRQSFFQRRSGVATLVATAAAGGQSYSVVDVPEEVAVALARAADPELVTQFLA